MHLKSITLKGFKSFPERTQLEFSPGVSVIVGPERMREVEHHRRRPLGPRRAEPAGGPRPVDAGRDLRRRQGPLRSQQRRGRGRHRQLRRRGRLGVLRDLGHAPPRPQRRWRLPPQRRPLPARRRHRGALRRQPRPRDAFGDRPGQGRGDRPLEATRAAAADRGGRRARQAPQAPPPRTAEAGADALEPRSRPRRRARGALPAAARCASRRTPPRPTPASSASRSSCSCACSATGSRPAAETSPLPRQAARGARAERDAIEAKLGAANERRSAVEERLAERDRERTAVWGELTALRAAHERLGARTESIAGREAELPCGRRAPSRGAGFPRGRAAGDRARRRGGAGA